MSFDPVSPALLLRQARAHAIQSVGHYDPRGVHAMYDFFDRMIQLDDAGHYECLARLVETLDSPDFDAYPHALMCTSIYRAWLHIPRWLDAVFSMHSMEQLRLDRLIISSPTIAPDDDRASHQRAILALIDAEMDRRVARARYEQSRIAAHLEHACALPAAVQDLVGSFVTSEIGSAPPDHPTRVTRVVPHCAQS